MRVHDLCEKKRRGWRVKKGWVGGDVQHGAPVGESEQLDERSKKNNRRFNVKCPNCSSREVYRIVIPPGAERARYKVVNSQRDYPVDTDMIRQPEIDVMHCGDCHFWWTWDYNRRHVKLRESTNEPNKLPEWISKFNDEINRIWNDLVTYCRNNPDKVKYHIRVRMKVLLYMAAVGAEWYSDFPHFRRLLDFLKGDDAARDQILSDFHNLLELVARYSQTVSGAL